MQKSVLAFSIELSKAKWKLAFDDGRRDRPRIATIEAWDFDALTHQVRRARQAMQIAEQARMVSCYEAGREGFSVHRRLVQMGIDNRIIDSASLEVQRRARRAKTDRIDAERLVAKLLSHLRGEKAFSVVRVPAVEDEDARHQQRELDDLKVERARHRLRIQSFLLTEGVSVRWSENLLDGLDKMTTIDGRMLSPTMKQRIRDEAERLAVACTHIQRIEEARREALKATPERGKEGGLPGAELVRMLTRLRGIGPKSGFRLVLECFAWRRFKNRREVGAFFGLAPTPFASGQMGREQGIAKIGRGGLRSLLIELSWLWLRYQPKSRISRWYARRFANGKRVRRVGIIAVARRLAIALWSFVTYGVVPEGALMD